MIWFIVYLLIGVLMSYFILPRLNVIYGFYEEIFVVLLWIFILPRAIYVTIKYKGKQCIIFMEDR
jgi:hypothetical protein